jgi:hypothetical protein
MVLAGFFYINFIFLAKPNEILSIQAVDDNDWYSVPLGGETICGDGSEYYILNRKGSSNNLIIHFSGGGACWDDKTCFAPITYFSAFFGNQKKSPKFYLPKF